ncbi:hypothetical protein BDQ17DRAFT_335087 [Cyathus striatus]|nr:hypothetical protein BDQ17DRAFT_335087 [Cyathus striatus]
MSFRDRVVNLAHLTDLKLHDNTPECGNLLAHISFPTSADISFTCESNKSTEADYSSILSVFSRPSVSYFVNDEGPFLGVTFHIHPQGVTFSGYATTTPVNFPELDIFSEKPIIHLDFSWGESSTSIAQQVMLSVCAALPLYGIKTAYVNSQREQFDTNAWGHALGQIDSLTKLGVVGSSAHSFLPALLLHIDSEVSGRCSSHPLLCFMSLVDLTFDDVDFGGSREEEGAEWSEMFNVMKHLRQISLIYQRYHSSIAVM